MEFLNWASENQDLVTVFVASVSTILILAIVGAIAYKVQEYVMDTATYFQIYYEIVSRGTDTD